MVPSGGIRERFDRYVRAVGAGEPAPWLTIPGVTAEEVAAAEAELGWSLPADLVELLSISNGGRFLDPMEWIGCRYLPAYVAEETPHIRDLLEYERVTPPLLLPGPRSIPLAVASHVGLMYDLDDEPGRILYWDVVSDWGAYAISPSLASLLDLYIERAEAGKIVYDAATGFPTGIDAVNCLPFGGPSST